MNKIIGFLITKEKVKLHVDFFNVGLRLITLTYGNYYIYLWGIGDIENCKISNKFSLSFPLHDSLFDRNVLIYFENGSIIIENDWLGSIPVFYNEKEQSISTISNFCIKNKIIDKDGLAGFCEFGYSVFEHTIFEDIKFMRYYSKLIVSDNTIRVEYKDDPVFKNEFLHSVSTTEEVLSKIHEYTNSIESRISGEIIIPTSGGYDSRLLNYLVKDKSRIRSFTYGISANQSESFEVVYAKKLSEILGTKWEMIELDEFYKYIDKWFEVYGISTHLHGMYHIEFYSKILERKELSKPTLLSGIFGDVWSGNVNYPDITNPKDLVIAGYTHGLNLSLKYLKVDFSDELKNNFFINNREYLNSDKLKPLVTVRLKIILISYLTIIPEYFGIPTWTPFLNLEIVKAILSLPERERKNRMWQKNLYRKLGINIEEMNLKVRKDSQLDYVVAKKYIEKYKFEPLDLKLLKTFFDEERIIQINDTLNNITLFTEVINKLMNIRKIGGVLRRIGVQNKFIRALYDYFVLKAIEKVLKYVS